MNYNDLYRNGGFKAASRDWLLGNTDLPAFAANFPSPLTLLDAGCGDGEWSWLLSEWYQVTGLDLAHEGIAAARSRPPTPHARSAPDFQIGSALDLPAGAVYDIVFARAPSFLNHPTNAPLLRKNLEYLLHHSRHRVYYIKYTKEPFERWVNSKFFEGFDTDAISAPDSKWYYNDPKLLEQSLQAFSRARVSVAGNYLIAVLEPV